ncbi:hypothetical protein ACFWDQ_21025 [Streptomyces sp. NPDC060053]|uniref:hypothetical protein n=1 Tax=Streptomyces sp. NPDC060053 TaxID=3347047 RepID=UPI00368E31C9
MRVETGTGTCSEGRSAATGPVDSGLGRPDAQRLSVVSSLTPKSDAAQSHVRQVRSVAPPTGTHPLVGGTDAVLVDARESIADRLPRP